MDAFDPIKVLILHGDPIAQAGLSAAFGRYPDLEVQDRPNPLDCASQPPSKLECGADVVVADYAIGVAVAARTAKDPAASLKVVVITGIDREWEIRSALEQGVRGYLLVGCALDALAAAVRAVHRGARHLSPQVADRLAESVTREPLTAREEEVLHLVVEGLSNKAIAIRLEIAVGTVKSHLKSAFDKLNVQSRTQAAGLVEQRGLLDRSRQRLQANRASEARFGLGLPRMAVSP
jgi:two-component system response regulator DesR